MRYPSLIVRRAPLLAARTRSSGLWWSLSPPRQRPTTAAPSCLFSSSLAHSPAYVGQCVAPDKNLKVMMLDPRQDAAVWDEYQQGMKEAYAKYGMEVESEQDPAQTKLLAVVVDHNNNNKDKMIGGIRVEGPFYRAKDIPAMRAIEGQPDADLVVDRVEQLCFSSSSNSLLTIMEGRGNWTSQKGISNALARAYCHLKWMTNADYMAGFSARHTLGLYHRNGYDIGDWLGDGLLDHVPVFAYPDERYESVQMMMTPEYMSTLDAPTRQLVRYEQRVLTPAKIRYHNNNTASTITTASDTTVDEDPLTWIPEILLDDDPRVKELSSRPGVKVVDHVATMYQELSQGILPKVSDPLVLNEPPHWVYFPWRQTLLRMLGPKGYKLLRTDRNRYKMTLDEMERLRHKAVAVLGMSVGHSCAVSLAQEGVCGHLNLADFDELELPNMNRIPTSIAELGENKTAMTARRIAEIDPFLTVDAYPEGATQDNIGDVCRGMDCIVEECDSFDIKVLARFEAAKQRIPVIMEASDLGVLDVERYDTDPDRPPFHGLAGESLVPEDMKDLSTDDKAPLMLDILELEKLSPRLVASFMEVDRTISSWPQLARDVALGGALVSAAVHRLFLDPDSLPSGRSRSDLNAALTNLIDPILKPQEALPAEALTSRDPLPHDPLEAIYESASWAPSGGNQQPWSFSHDDDCFHVAASPLSQKGMDYRFRATAVACGAALSNAASMASWKGLTNENPILLARDLGGIEEKLANGETVRIGSVQMNNPTISSAKTNFVNEWSELGPFVQKRTTNRQKGPITPLSPAFVSRLKKAGAAVPKAQVHYLPADHVDFELVLDACCDAERIRFLDSHLHRDLFDELVWPGSDMSRGIDVRTLELTAKQERLLRVLRRVDAMQLLREWHVGERLGEDAREQLRASAGVIAIGVTGTGSFQDYVQGGMAMERVWLTATKLGLSIQPWAPVFSFTQSLLELSQLVGPNKADALFPKARAAFDAIGLRDGQDHFVLFLRVHEGPPPSVISGRSETPRFFKDTRAEGDGNESDLFRAHG